MIKYIEIENFKSLYRFVSPMERLNLFFGLNGAGKSSVLQSLLLLRQSYLRYKMPVTVLHLNEQLISLGTAKDVLSQNAVSDEIRFDLVFDAGKNADFRFSYGPIPSANMLKIKALVDDDCYSESLFGKDFYYLAADHISPQRQYDRSSWESDGKYNLGVHGEYVVPFLADHGESFVVDKTLCLKEARSNRLIDQLSAWMALISPGIRLSAETFDLEQYSKLLISYEEDRFFSDKYSPVNVGFGIPYVLPLIVELLISNKNTLMLIENPESHLHPKGQASIGKLISLAAANGAQIFCESHSDHVINGVRVAVKDNLMDFNDLNIIYFDKDKEQHTKTCNIKVDQKGALSDYPEGFLDEWGILLSQLL